MNQAKKVTFEVKKQYVVDCTYGKYGFDKKVDADAFEETAIEKDFHLKEDENPISRRESFVLWKGDEFVEELEAASTLEEAQAYAEEYIEVMKIKLFN